MPPARLTCDIAALSERFSAPDGERGEKSALCVTVTWRGVARIQMGQEKGPREAGASNAHRRHADTVLEKGDVAGGSRYDAIAL